MAKLSYAYIDRNVNMIYEMLRELPSLKDCPPVANVDITVDDTDKGMMGYCIQVTETKWEIGINPYFMKTYADLVSTMAHEMCHILVDQLGKPIKDVHGKPFQKFASRAGKELGIDIT